MKEPIPVCNYEVSEKKQGTGRVCLTGDAIHGRLKTGEVDFRKLGKANVNFHPGLIESRVPVGTFMP